MRPACRRNCNCKATQAAAKPPADNSLYASCARMSLSRTTMNEASVSYELEWCSWDGGDDELLAGGCRLRSTPRPAAAAAAAVAAAAAAAAVAAAAASAPLHLLNQTPANPPTHPPTHPPTAPQTQCRCICCTSLSTPRSRWGW